MSYCINKTALAPCGSNQAFKNFLVLNPDVWRSNRCDLINFGQQPIERLVKWFQPVFESKGCCIPAIAPKWGSQGGLVVINHASHLCDPGSTLASGRIWAEFQSKLNLTQRVFLRVLRFSSLLKIDSRPIPSGCGAVLRGHTWVVFSGGAPSWQHSSFSPTSLICSLSNSVSDCEKGRLERSHIIIIIIIIIIGSLKIVVSTQFKDKS